MTALVSTMVPETCGIHQRNSLSEAESQDSYRGYGDGFQAHLSQEDADQSDEEMPAHAFAGMKDPYQRFSQNQVEEPANIEAR